MPEFPRWFNVNKDIRVWAGHKDNAQKQGWIYAPGAIEAVEEYKGSFRFENAKGVGICRLDYSTSEGYPNTWVRIADVTTEPFEPGPDPEPEPEPGPDIQPGDAEIGAAFRTLVAYVSSYFN